MNQDFMDPEIFADFIIEAREHLETIEPNLLELEQTPENLELLNDVFRPMHSLKGASGFLGLDKINRLAHRSENVMDELRKGRMQVTSGIMDVILASTDLLRSMIENLESEGNEGDVDVEPTVQRLDALLAGEEAPAPEAAAAPEAESVPEPAAEPVLEQAPEAVPDAAVLEPYSLTIVAKDHLDDFLEEAKEIVETVNSSLLQLEKDPAQGGELINNIFRYFHNLKGNSGIVGYREVNSLTHEAETLLNKVRNNELEANRGMIDLLLAVLDAIDTLIGNIDTEKYEAAPIPIQDLVDKLQAASAGEEIEPPSRPGAADVPVAEAPAAEAPAAEAPAAGDVADAGSGVDPEDVTMFRDVTGQQKAAVDLALAELAKDDSQKDYIDGLYRALTTVQNSAAYMGMDAVKSTAEQTAGLVDQARNSDMDFGLMLDILGQETGIIFEMVDKELAALSAAPDPAPAPAPEPAPAPAPEPAPAPAPEPAPAPAPEPEPAPAPAPEPAPAPKASAPAPAPAPKAAPKPKAAAPPKKPKVSSTIRVDHEKLDHLMNLIGELIINRNRFTMIARHMEDGTDLDLAETATNLTETTYAMARISDDLQDTIMKVRMVPVQSVFARFPRLVRDLSRKSGKQVDLVTDGEETELDKSVVEVIGDPLVHLIRNAVDHGLEDAEGRAEAGKPEMGKVYLRAYHKGNSVAIEIEDDGKGIDPEKMREVGIRKGVVTPEEAKALDDQQAIELIFAPGFSSAEKITDISGRGVGMDVVRTNIKNLKGSVTINSVVGKGSKFIMSLPLTLAIIDALMVKVAGETFAIPLDAVSETTKIEASRLTEVNGRKAVTLRGEVLGIVNLWEMLEMEHSSARRDILPIVVIQDNHRRLGLVVDTLLERQEIVIKPLGKYLGDREGISGATIMGDGSVVLILDPHEIYRMSTTRA